MNKKTFKEHSKTEWYRSDGLNPSDSQIQVGAIQRIADATEKMASNYTALQNDRDMYKRWYNEEQARVASRNKTISALRGVITKMKKENGK